MLGSRIRVDFRHEFGADAVFAQAAGYDDFLDLCTMTTVCFACWLDLGRTYQATVS